MYISSVQLARGYHERPGLALPLIGPPSASGAGPEATVSIRLSADEAGAVLGLSRALGGTRFMLWYAAITAVLARHSRQTDFGVGAVMANREASGSEGLLGFFTNTVVLRTDLSSDPTFRELHARARKTAIDAYKHQSLPFDVMVQLHGGARKAGENPLFEVTFIEETATSGGLLEEVNIASELPDVGTSAKIGLAFSVQHDGPDGAVVRLTYDASRSARAAVARIGEHLRALLLDATRRPDERISRLSMLGEGESEELSAWGRGAAVGHEEACIHHLFEAHAARAPEAIALEFDGAPALTYGELDRRANVLAHHLRGRGVGPEVIVGLCLHRSPEWVLGALAVLKAGGAYMPIDPAYPAERRRFMLADSGAALLLTESRLAMEVAPDGVPSLCLDAKGTFDEGLPVTALEGGASPRSAAYAIYTSGSTGQPKGVLVEHRNLASFVRSHQAAVQMGPGVRCLQISGLGFDVATGETFATLTSGATLCICPADKMYPGPELAALLREQRIGIIHTTPTVLSVTDAEGLPDLRTVFCGGEALAPQTARRWSKGRALYNAYGPTETVVCITTSRASDERGAPHIGRPMADTTAYVLDARLQPTPKGAPGELYLGGAQTVRGYIGFTSREMAGAHESMLREPHAAGLAAAVSDALGAPLQLDGTKRTAR